MSKHVHFLGVVTSVKGGSTELFGPFVSRADAVDAVQKELGEGNTTELGGVVAFDLVESLPAPAPAPAPAPEKPTPPEGQTA